MVSGRLDRRLNFGGSGGEGRLVRLVSGTLNGRWSLAGGGGGGGEVGKGGGDDRRCEQESASSSLVD